MKVAKAAASLPVERPFTLMNRKEITGYSSSLRNFLSGSPMLGRNAP